MIGEIRQNFTEASASVGLILATALKALQNISLSSSFGFENKAFVGLILQYDEVTSSLNLELKLLCYQLEYIAVSEAKIVQTKL